MGAISTPAPTLSAIGDWLDGLPRWLLSVGSVLAVLLLGWVDYVTGPAIAFSVFYLLPIAAVAWKYSRWIGVGISLLSALTWITADLLSGETYSQSWIPVWNTMSRFAVFVLVVGLIVTLRSALREQVALASTDPLTGVDNPRSFRLHAHGLLKAMREENTPLTIAYIDVDDFKQVNDALGHSGGDDLLRAIGAALINVTRDTDRVGRLGGDEFALLLPRTGSDGARQVIAGLHNRVQDALNTDQRLRVSLSTGAVTFLVAPQDIDDMLNTADNLMYEAKRAGKATYRHVTIGEGTMGAAEDRSAPRDIRDRVIDLTSV